MSFDITGLSSRFSVRRMCDANSEEILALCRENTQYYQYCGKQPTLELIRNDLQITPPGKTADDKYYLGFYDGTVLAAVMDLIVGYPEEAACFIGFFMMNKAMQGAGVGSDLIRDVCGHLREVGVSSVLLEIDRENPQSTHFWRKNGFQVIREVQQDSGTILVAKKEI